jgi:phosphoribosylaminoimidazole-succinocarboxamide synthase
MPDPFVDTITERYIELYEKITRLSFEKANNTAIEARIEKNVEDFLKEGKLI